MSGRHSARRAPSWGGIVAAGVASILLSAGALAQTSLERDVNAVKQAEKEAERRRICISTELAGSWERGPVLRISGRSIEGIESRAADLAAKLKSPGFYSVIEEKRQMVQKYTKTPIAGTEHYIVLAFLGEPFANPIENRVARAGTYYKVADRLGKMPFIDCEPEQVERIGRLRIAPKS